MFYHSGQALLHRVPGAEGGGGWGRVLNKALYRKTLSRGPTPLPLYHFHRKGTPFLTAVNALSVNMNKLQNQNDCLTFSQP